MHPKQKEVPGGSYTLQAAFRENDVDLEEAEVEKLIQVATLLMGMEAIIVTKDVCRLDNQASLGCIEVGPGNGAERRFGQRLERFKF